MIKIFKACVRFPKSGLKAKFSTFNQQTRQQVKQKDKKSYVMPPQPQTSSTVYLRRKLKFKDGRYLIYLNKQNLLTPFLLDLHYTIPLTYLGYLIVKNPFYLTFPAAFPIMIGLQLIIMFFWLRRKSIHKRQIQRIYLIDNFQQLEFIYANKVRRFVKNDEKNTFHMIDSFEPKYDKQVKEGRVIPYPSVRFPEDPYIPRQKAKMPNFINYGWSFRDKIFNTFILPAKYDFADWEILTKVLNGIIVYPLDYESEGDIVEWIFPSIEDEQKNLDELAKSIPVKPESETFQQNQAHSKIIQQRNKQNHLRKFSKLQFKTQV